MERSKIYTQYLGAFFRLALIVLIGGTASLFAQKASRRGMWGEVGFNLGGTLSDKSQLGLSNDMNFGGNFYVTALGVHIPQFNALQAGIGLYQAGYGNPDGLRHNGIHLDLRYAPIKTLERLQLSTMIGLPISNADMRITGDTKYHTKLYGTVAIGWELSRLLGKFGISPAIGISHTRFDYHRSLDGATRQGSSSQTTVFFRLGFRLN